MAAPARIGCSNWVLKWMNVMTMILSIPIIGVGIWLSTAKGSHCYTFLQIPVLVVGCLIFVISLIGYIGATCGWTWMLSLYLFFMGLLILLLLAFVLFAFIVTAPGGGTNYAGYKFKQYNLANYSGFLRNELNDTSNWKNIRSCLITANFCKILDDDYTRSDINQANLNPLESGCCLPPPECKFTPGAGTSVSVFTGSSTASPDCARWGNDDNTKCYNCDSCKGGAAAYVKSEWQTVAIINAVVVVILSLLYLFGLCARRNAWQPEFERLEKAHEQQFASGYSRGYQGNPGYQATAAAMRAKYQGGPSPTGS